MTPGLHSIASDQYHASAGISRSMLEDIAHPSTPAHYKARWIDKVIPEEETPAMQFGTILHRAMLEPETLAGAFHVKPENYDGRTKDGKKWQADHADRPHLTAAEALAVGGIVRSLMAHPKARVFIEKSDKERSAYADDNGLLLRSRYDLLPTWKGANMIADIKTCERADMASAEKSLMNYGYARQAAFYLRVAKLLNLDRHAFVLIFVEKSPPFAVAVYEVDPMAVDFGERLIARDLQVLRNCMESNQWPAYSQDIETLGLPAWAQKQAEQLA